MQGLGTELRGLATAVLSGMTMVCAYVCIRNLRKVFRHSRILVNVEDAVWKYRGSYYKLFAYMKYVIEANDFDFNKRMKELYPKKSA